MKVLRINVKDMAVGLISTGAHLAEQAAKNAMPHISGYRVGCAIISEDRSAVGANIEFDNFSNTIHAEEAAMISWFKQGSTSDELLPVIAVWTKDAEPWFPCGKCRQSLFEKFDPDCTVVATNGRIALITSLGELLPMGFRLEKK